MPRCRRHVAALSALMSLSEEVTEDHRDRVLIARVRAATEVLEQIVADRGKLAHLPSEDRQRFIRAAGQVYSPDNRARRRMVKAGIRLQKLSRVSREEKVLHADRHPQAAPAAGVQHAERLSAAGFEQRDVEDEPKPPEVDEPQHCYVCKQHYSTVHHFYDQLCPPCAEFNFAKRTELADLRGRVALLTGGRVKIGYQAGLKLLRAGAQLIVTTRFPRDSAARYAAEPDFAEWARPARDLRPRPAPHAERRGVLPRAARRRATGSTSSSTTPARRCAARPSSTST